MLQKTIFDNKVIAYILKRIAVGFFRSRKWSISDHTPSSVTKAVVVSAPHTAWFDLPYTILVASYLDSPIYWIGKEELFIWPFKRILTWLGGIPVKRKSGENKTFLVGKIIRDSQKKVFLIITPSGTRKNLPVAEWNKGYYYIAMYAKVPILFAYIDYRHKTARVSFPFSPTGDYDADIVVPENFYAHLIPKTQI